MLDAHPEICGCYLVPERRGRVPAQYAMKWRQVMNEDDACGTEVWHVEAMRAAVSWDLKYQGCDRRPLAASRSGIRPPRLVVDIDLTWHHMRPGHDLP